MVEQVGVRTYLYVPAERRVVVTDLKSLPVAGEDLAYGGRQYRVTAVHASQRPAIVSLEALALQLPAVT